MRYAREVQVESKTIEELANELKEMLYAIGYLPVEQKA